MHTEWVTLHLPDGSRMRAFVARPPGAERRPGLLMFQEAYGVNAHIRDVATRFAGEGYVVIAPEVYHRTAPAGYEAAYGDFAALQPHFQAITVAGLEADARAAHGWLAADSETDAERICSVGFCMGGRASYVAATALPLAAAVCFYGGGIAPALLDRAAHACPLLLFWGGRDKHILPEHHRALVDALRATGRSYVNVEFGAADHAFFCDARQSFNPTAAAQAWTLTLSFLTNAVA